MLVWQNRQQKNRPMHMLFCDNEKRAGIRQEKNEFHIKVVSLMSSAHSILPNTTSITLKKNIQFKHASQPFIIGSCHSDPIHQGRKFHTPLPGGSWSLILREASLNQIASSPGRGPNERHPGNNESAMWEEAAVYLYLTALICFTWEWNLKNMSGGT